MTRRRSPGIEFRLAWAQASRDAMVEQVAPLLERHLALRPLPTTRFSCVHNCSSSHGAGRALPRGEARRRLRVRDFTRAMHGIHWDEARAAALLDEAPAAYKEIGRVMRAQRELTRVVRRLEPVVNWKGAS